MVAMFLVPGKESVVSALLFWCVALSRPLSPELLGGRNARVISFEVTLHTTTHAPAHVQHSH